MNFLTTLSSLFFIIRGSNEMTVAFSPLATPINIKNYGRRPAVGQRRHCHQRQRQREQQKKNVISGPFITTRLLVQSDDTSAASAATFGLYRPIAELIWNKLSSRYNASQQQKHVEPDLQFIQAPARGGEGIVHMETRTMMPSNSDNHQTPIRYARMALLETLPITMPSQNNNNNNNQTSFNSPFCSTDGIQVLNLVIFPAKHTTLPVWGADFVSLPGNKHLLLLDAQPMQNDTSFVSHWQSWYNRHDIAKQFPWGGEMPEAVQSYVSSTALWTRFVVADVSKQPESSKNNNVTSNNQQQQQQVRLDNVACLSRIQGPLEQAVSDHLDIYFNLLDQQKKSSNDKSISSVLLDQQADYITYRRTNDPARPMLQALFGKEWTEQVSERVLFPSSLL